MLNSQSEQEKRLWNVNIDIFQDIFSAAENVCIKKKETVRKEGDDPNKKVKSTSRAILTQTFHICSVNPLMSITTALRWQKNLEKEEVNQRKEVK